MLGTKKATELDAIRPPRYRNAVATVARILDVAELQGDRCVACGAPSETYVDLVTPEGVVVPKPPAAMTASVCRTCAQSQADAPGIGSRLIYALVAIPPVTGIAAGLAVGRLSGVPASIGVAFGLVAARIGIWRIKRARAGATRVMLLEAEDERVVLQLEVPVAARSTGVYRSAAFVTTDDEVVTALPPRTSFGLPWFGTLIVSSLVLVAAWSGAFSREAIVVIDSAGEATRVEINGAGYYVRGIVFRRIAVHAPSPSPGGQML